MKINKLNLFPKQQVSNAGFSLIEILIALTLLGLVGTFVTGKIFALKTEGEIKATHVQMNSIKGLLKEYRRKCGMYPTTDQSLEALLSKPTSGRECKNYPADGFIDGDMVPQDAWSEDFIYESNGKKFEIISYGPDREEGGEGTDADISSNKKKKSSE
jgi:general secretion pathway protein G